MHSPRILFAVGAVAFVIWMLWLMPSSPDRTPASPAQEAGKPRTSAAVSDNAVATADAEPTKDRAAPTARPRNIPAPVRVSGHDEATATISPGVAAPDDAEAPAEAEQQGDLAISGRLLTVAGDPVPNIEVRSRPITPRGSASSSNLYRGRSDAAGAYKIEGLPPGDYDVRTVATASYPSTGGRFRAGLQSADIILAGSNTVQVFGRVTDKQGTPLAKAEIGPGGNDAIKVWTDDGGNYRTQLTVANPAASYTVRVSLDGYLEERVHLQGKELIDVGEFRVDVELRRLDATTMVSGRLRSARGEPASGERVQLQSASLGAQYLATSKGDGTFSMSAVVPADDYRITIHPKGAFENYWQQGVAIGGSGRFLDITLQPLDSGRLTGRMVDVRGFPLPGFALLLKSNKSQSRYVPVTSDDGGYFVVENAPAGNLMFVTRSEPRFVVSGIRLDAGTAAEAEVVIDWGDHELSGQVSDEQGAAVAGAEVKLSWRHAADSTQSTSLRRSVSDGDGFFRFAQLGPGPHQLDVVATDYQAATQLVLVDSYSSKARVTLREQSQ